MSNTMVLLPGMDGTGRLFGPVLDVMPRGFEARVVLYPPQAHGYAACAALARDAFPRSGRFIIVAESFSCGVALSLSGELDERCVGLVLVSAFLRDPHPVLGKVARHLPDAAMRLAPAPRLIRTFLLGSDAPDALVQLAHGALVDTPVPTLQGRLEAMTHLDVREQWRTCRRPMFVFRARSDRLVPESTARQLSLLRPDVPVETLAGPHLLLQRRAGAMLSRVEMWMRSRATSSA